MLSKGELRMRKRNILIIAGIIVLIPVLAGAWWLLSPLFMSQEVDEAFPRAAMAVVPPEMTMAQAEAEMKAAADENMPEMTEPMPPAGPVAVAYGNFRDADSFHRGQGTATLYRQADDTYLLRFEDFRVTNGPDLRVLLAAAANPQSRGELQEGGYLELAPLKGNIGSQNYEIPPEVDPVAEGGSVIIYCRPFQVIFSVAPLQPAG